MRRPGPTPLATAHQGGGLPAGEVSSGLRLRRQPNIDAATVHTLASCEWIKKSRPLCLIGDLGTGKSHTLIALGTEAAIKGYCVRYTLATKLVNELVEAADEKQLNKTIARYGRIDLFETESLRVRRCRVLRSVVGEGETDRSRLQSYLVLGLTVRLSGGDLSSAAPADQVQAMAACRALAAAH